MQMALTEEESDFDAILIVHVVVVSDVGSRKTFILDTLYTNFHVSKSYANWIAINMCGFFR